MNRWIILKWHLMLMLIALVSAPGSARGQNVPAALKRIGILSTFGCPVAADSALSRRLAELGWVEGKNFTYDCVPTAGRLDQIDQLAAELVARHPDIVTAIPNRYVKALKRVTTTIPIVMGNTPDPIGSGLVTNLARPEANVTGVASFGYDIMPKRVEILKEVLPQMKRLAIIFTANADPEATKAVKANAAIAGEQLGVSLQVFLPAIPEDFDKIFGQLSEQQFDAAYVEPSPLAIQNFKRIVDLALRDRLPTISNDPLAPRSGLLLSYGEDYARALVRLPDYIDKILRGAQPSELPITQPTKLDLVINLKTARAIGVTVPATLLGRADEVIE